MRKFAFTLLMAGILAFSLAACKKGEEAASPEPAPIEAEVAPEPMPAPPPPPVEVAPEPEPAPAPEEATPPVD